MKELTIFVPDLAGCPAQNLTKTRQTETVQNLNAIFKYANKTANQQCFLESFQKAMGYGDIGDFSIAWLTALADEIDVGNRYCLRIDPVELKADLAAVYMYGNYHIQLSSQQRQRIAALIQPLLVEQGMKLVTTNSNRWYLTGLEKPEIITHDPNSLIGKDILQFLPSGKQARKWQTLQTEIQMLLHEHNEISPINSMWIWGEGKVTHLNDVSKKTCVFSDSAMAIGLAKCTQQDYKKLPDFSLQALQHSRYQQNFLFLESFLSIYDDVTYWKALCNLSETYLAIALSALKKKYVDKIQLYPMNGFCYTLTRKDFYAFWHWNKIGLDELWKK